MKYLLALTIYYFTELICFLIVFLVVIFSLPLVVLSGAWELFNKLTNKVDKFVNDNLKQSKNYETDRIKNNLDNL